MLQQNLFPFRISKQLTCRHSPFLTISFSFSSSKASMVFTCFSFPFNLCHWTQTHSINPLLFHPPENKTSHALQHLTKAAPVIKGTTSTIHLLKINVWTLPLQPGLAGDALDQWHCSLGESELCADTLQGFHTNVCSPHPKILPCPSPAGDTRDWLIISPPLQLRYYQSRFSTMPCLHPSLLTRI